MRYYRTEDGLIDYQKTRTNIAYITRKMSDDEFKKEARKIIKRAQSRVNLLTGKQSEGKYEDLANYVPHYARDFTSALFGLNRQGIMQKLKLALRILGSDWSTVEGARRRKAKRIENRTWKAKKNWGITYEEINSSDFWVKFREIEEYTGWKDDSDTVMKLTKIAHREDVPIDKVSEIYFQREQEKFDAYENEK